MVQYLFLVCCVTLFPAKPMAPLSTMPLRMRRLRHHMFLFCFVFVNFCLFYFSFRLFDSALLLVSYVVLGPLAGHRPACFVLFFSPISALYMYILPSCLFASSFSWSINWTGLIVPANSNLVPRALSACLFLFS